ncbi:hypothetical protein [Thermus sp. NEB1569]|uniref:hypothetical protein n=1 Tax=Thermus sp. NEB1569 TaxID=2918899 RepID=UPI001EFAD7BF|nr:hypothetical protein [Thermus sp. NEB1569]ULR41225.1 hypothetical protein MI302_02870 [Thermus sp. NEB1569]
MKERLERALGIALDRAKREMRALIGRADNPPVIALALDRMAAEVDPVAEPARALNAFDRHLGLDRLASWADVQRVLNALEAVEEAEGIRHVSIRIAELLYKGQEISEEAVKAERLLMRLQELGYEVTVWPEPRDSSLESWEWIAMALVEGVEVAEAWGTNHDEAIVALARELGHAEAAD